MATSAGVSLCCMLLVVAMATSMAAADGLTCTTNSDSALVEDAHGALSRVQEYVLCQKECDGDKCTVVGEYATAQLKMCGRCNACIPFQVGALFFMTVLEECPKAVDGSHRVSGKYSPNDDYVFVIEGKKVDAGIEMKLRA